MIADYQILKETINRVLVESSLDIGAQYFILKDIFHEAEKKYFATINAELMRNAKGGTENAESV